MILWGARQLRYFFKFMSARPWSLILGIAVLIQSARRMIRIAL